MKLSVYLPLVMVFGAGIFVACNGSEGHFWQEDWQTGVGTYYHGVNGVDDDFKILRTLLYAADQVGITCTRTAMSSCMESRAPIMRLEDSESTPVRMKEIIAEHQSTPKSESKLSWPYLRNALRGEALSPTSIVS